MDLKQFEDKLNNKFKDYEPVVDGMKIWDNIEDQLPQPKKKRRFAWFLILVPIFLVGAYFTLNQGKGQNSSAISSKEISSLDQKQSTSTKEIQQTNDLIKTNVASKKKQDLSLEETNQSSANKVKKALLNPVRSSTVSEALPAVKQNNLMVEEPKKFAKANKQNNEAPTSINVVEVASNLELGLNAVKVNETKVTSEIANDELVEDNQNLLPETNSNAVLITEKEAVEESTSDIVTRQIEKEDPKKPVDPIKEEITDKEDTILPVEENEKATKFDASSSISATFTVFGGAQNFFNVAADQEALISKRNEVEKSLEALQFGLEYERTISKRLGFTTGLRVWQHTRSSDHAVQNVTEEILSTLTEVDHLPDGSIENVYEDVSTQVTESYSAVRYLRYQSLSALALLNYQLIDGKKTTLDLGAGFEVGLKAAQTGYELDTELTEYLITEDRGERYKKRSGDYLVLRLRSMIELSDHWNWSIGLESKYALNGIQTDGLGFNQKFNFLGIQTGFNYTF